MSLIRPPAATCPMTWPLTFAVRTLNGLLEIALKYTSSNVESQTIL